MITRRDIAVAVVAVSVTAAVVAAQPTSALRAMVGKQAPTILQSTTFEWTSMAEKKTDVGSVRQIVRAPTVTLDELEMHVTTLNPGQTSHAPHQHPNEELIIIKEGTVEVLNLGVWKRLGVGSIVFNASNQLHAIRNVGTGPTTYHVINWKAK